MQSGFHVQLPNFQNIGQDNLSLRQAEKMYEFGAAFHQALRRFENDC